MTAEREAREATRSLGLPLAWPEDLGAADPADAERIIFAAADRMELNVFRTNYGSDSEGRTTVTHYIYLANEGTQLFDAFTLDSGRWLTAEESGVDSARVSTASNQESEIVGTPRVFADAFDLTFAPLASAFTALPTTGAYVIETKDPEVHQRFLRTVLDGLEQVGVEHLSVEDLGTESPSSVFAEPTWSRHLPYGVAAVVSVLTIALVSRSSKSFGVRALLGHSPLRMWVDTVGYILSAALSIGIAGTSVIALLVPHTNTAFVGTVLGVNVAIAVFTLVLSLGASLLLTQRISTTDLVKGSLR